MAEKPNSKQLRDYASFELERKGYDRAQVDAFIAELDQAFEELEKSVHERGTEIAELQQEVERLKRESPVGKSEELLKRAEANAAQMLASSLEESQEIIENAEVFAMRIIANARAQSQELASQPAGFGMLARVRTIAADIDRIKAEHTALMNEELGVLSTPTELKEAVETEAPAEPAQDSASEKPVEKPTKDSADEKPKDLADAKPAAKKQPATAAKSASGDTKPAKKAAPAKSTKAKAPAKKKPATKKPAAAAASAAVDDAAEDEAPKLPRIQLVEPAPPLAATKPIFGDEDDDDVTVDTKNFDWGAAREQVLHALDDEDDVLDDEDPEAAAEVVKNEPVPDKAPTSMARSEKSRYEKHSASLPKIGSEGESTLSDVSKVSRRRRRRATTSKPDETR